jgi:hypothetical protein
LHTGELQKVVLLLNIIRTHVARVEDIRNMYRVLIGKPEGKIPHERNWMWECGIGFI